jgi:hypothetical protein
MSVTDDRAAVAITPDGEDGVGDGGQDVRVGDHATPPRARLRVVVALHPFL